MYEICSPLRLRVERTFSFFADLECNGPTSGLKGRPSIKCQKGKEKGPGPNSTTAFLGESVYGRRNLKTPQGVPICSWTGLGRLEFNVFHCLPNSVWADGNLAEAAEQDDGTHKSKSTQPRSTSRWDHLKTVPKESIFLEEVHFFGKSVQICVQIMICTLHFV